MVIVYHAILAAIDALIVLYAMNVNQTCFYKVKIIKYFVYLAKVHVKIVLVINLAVLVVKMY